MTISTIPAAAICGDELNTRPSEMRRFLLVSLGFAWSPGGILTSSSRGEARKARESKSVSPDNQETTRNPLVLWLYCVTHSGAPELHIMIAAFICVMSLAALVQFAVSQWRSIWITVAAQPLSNALEAATGIANEEIGAEHFDMLIRASAQVDPAPQEGNLWLKEVKLYYRTLQACVKLSGTALPSVSNWAKRELTECSKFAAAILDQRLNANFAYSSESQLL
jgi:hypothetical protein